MRHSRTMIVLFVLIALATTAVAAPPTTVSYQGRLTTSAGAPVPNGTYSVRFSLWSDATLGTESWSETQMVSVTDGLFSTELGSVSGGFFDISVCPPYCDAYLQIEVTIGGGVVTISPRSHLSASPWSLVSRSHYSESSSGLQKAKGTIKNGTGGGMPNGIIVLEGDADGDGHADYSLNDSVSTSSASRSIGRDLTGDGVPDLVVASTVDANSAHFEVGDKPTQAQFGTMLDSYVNMVDDRAVLGIKTSKPTVSAWASVFEMMVTPDSAASFTHHDADNDGIAESEISSSTRSSDSRWTLTFHAKPFVIDLYDTQVEQICDEASARSTWRGGMSGSTTGTIKMAAAPDSVVSVLEHDSDGDGIAEARRLVLVNGSVGSSSKLQHYGGGMLVNEASTEVNAIETRNILKSFFQTGDFPTQEQRVSASGSTFRAINTKGTGATIRTAMESTDSAGLYLDTDADGDGHSEAEANLAAILNGNVVIGGTADSDDDGVPDNSAEMTITPTKSSLAIKTKGTSAQRFSAGTDCDDANALMFAGSDADGDGVAENTVEHKTTPTSSSSIIKGGMSGSTTGTIRMQATKDSGVVEIGYSGSTTATIRLQASPSVTADPIVHSSGAILTVGGVWTNASDKTLKENFEQVDGAEILEKIEDLPISEWNYKAEGDNAKHIGPTAQDFSDAFGLGSNDKTISTIDPSGVALVAIKELTKQNKELKKKNTELENKLNDLQKQIEKLASSMKK